MQLEVGKTYVNRLGKLCKIVEYDSDPDNVYPYMDNNGREYIESGNFYLIVEDDFDLIEEYQPLVQPTKPLTLEQIQDMHAEANKWYCIDFEDYMRVVRDTEFKHGIGE